MNLKEYLDGLSLPSGRSKRSDCPVCGGSNSFSVTNNSGILVYNCYKASCTAHGASQGVYTIEDAAKSLEIRLRGNDTKPEVPFTLPPYFRPIEGQGERYLDVKENRTVYIIRDKYGAAVDAAGRTNVKGVSPKWKRYARSEHPYVAGPWTGICVIVEDCISAEAVNKTGVYTGLALLGTNLLSGVGYLANNFDGCIVCLDMDAAAKGVVLAERISWTLPATTVLLKDDLKYFKPAEIIEQLKDAREYLNNVRAI